MSGADCLTYILVIGGILRIRPASKKRSHSFELVVVMCRVGSRPPGGSLTGLPQLAHSLT